MRLSMMQSSKRPLLVIRPLVKAMRATGVLAKAANIPPGARWITLHGDSEGGGQHVLIVPTGDGAYRVAAGAGGKLNHMRLTQVRSQAQYAKDAAEKKAKKKAEQPEDDDETKKAKKAALKDIKDQRKQAKQDFLRVVDEYIGKIYGDKKPGPDDDKADDAPEENEQEKMRNAVATVAKVRKQLVEHIKEGGVHIPGVTVGIDSDELMDIRDLDPTSRERDPTKGARDRVPVPHGEHQGEGEPGSAVGSGAATPGEEGQEAIRVRQESTSEDKGGSLGEVTGTELRQNILLLKVDEFGNPVKPDELDMQAAIDLVKAEKKLRKQQREARKAEKKVRSVETVEQVLAAKSAVVDIHELDANDKDVAEALRNDLTSATALGFLDRLKEHNPDFENYLGNHIADGGYYSINAMTTTVGGVAMVDRAVVDVLGIAGASQVAMRQVMKEHPDRADKLAKAMADYHVSDQVKRTQDAMDKADKALAAAKELEGTHELYDGDDYFYLQELAHERKTELEAADRALGVALGEMEANATIVHTLENGVKDEVQVGMGKMGVDDVAKKLQAIGLDESDYVISDVNATRSAKILASGLDKLARPVDKEALQRQRDAIAITRGDYDEDDWLPEGVADRPDLAIDSEPGVAPQLQQEFQFSGNVTESAHDYIGGRIADGDRPEDVLADLTSDAIIDKVGAKNAKKLSDLADRLRHENPAVMQEHLQTLADKYVQKKFGASRSPLHRQTLPVEHNTVEAAHRAMAESPTAKLAFTPVGELKAADQRTLREWYAANVGHGDSEQGKKLQAQYNELLNNEPSKEAEGTTTRAAPEWVRWRKKVDSVHSKLSKLGVPWSEYAAAHNSTAEAYATVQDLVKSQYVQRFAHHYNRLNPKNPLKIGKAAVRNNMHHLSAIAPDMVSKTNAERGDRFGRLDKETRETLGDSVLNLQGREAGGALRQDERYTLGQAAEGTLAGVAAKVGRQFVAGQPVKLWKASMNGKYVDQQRAIKLIDKNKRVALALGTGSGKSIVMLGAIAHLKNQGKIKRAVMAVPSIVQGQMNGEALRYLEPGKFKWFADTGASREQRIAALKDPSHDFVVMTHQSLRDDLVHLAAEANGSTPEAEAAKVSAMNKAEAREWMKNTMEHHNINFDAAFYDEAHATLDRAGKADSLMSNVLQGVSDNAEYYAHASADPAKNDSSEVYSLLSKIDPARFNDRQEFLRRYGSGTNGAAASLRRVLSGYVMAGHIQTGNKVHRKEVKVKITPEQEKALSDLDTRVAQAKLNSAAGKVDVDLIKQLAPGAFEGKPESQHEDIARHMQKHVSLLHETARKQVLDGKMSAKRDAVVNEIKARQGKPGMVFARSLEAVADMKKRLEQQGLKVATLTGSDSAESKASKGRGFNELGKYDVLVSSDAGAVGLNAQRGQWLIQYDVPQTAMVHAQRNGRVDRLGQQNEVELIDMVADHPVERRARKRLSHKYDLRKIITEPYSALDDTGLGHYLARATQG